MILKTLLSAVLLVTSGAVGAQEPGADDASAAPDSASWQAVSTAMSREEYTQVYRENRRFLRNLARSGAKATLVSLGVSKSIVGVFGTAAALVLEEDAKLKLNRSKTLALEFTDMADAERAVLIGYTLHW
jgi:hypothetical protein